MVEITSGGGTGASKPEEDRKLRNSREIDVFTLLRDNNDGTKGHKHSAFLQLHTTSAHQLATTLLPSLVKAGQALALASNPIPNFRPFRTQEVPLITHILSPCLRRMIHFSNSRIRSSTATKKLLRKLSSSAWHSTLPLVCVPRPATIYAVATFLRQLRDLIPSFGTLVGHSACIQHLTT